MDLPSHKAHSSQAKDSADLSYSRLVEVPAELFRLHHLRTLRLDNNSLSNVPWSSLMALESLTHVNLSHNKLTELPETLAKWNTVEVLDVSHNNIAAFSHVLRPLLLRAHYIIPLQAYNPTGKPIPNEPTIECPHLTRALIKQFGHKMPPSFRAHYPPRFASFSVVAASAETEVMDYASTAKPHFYWRPSWGPEGSEERWDVRPGPPFWKLAPGAAPRVKLDGNTVLEKLPRLESNPIQLAAEWERLPTTTVGDESSGSGGSSDDAKTDRKKDARENTRRVRREQRHKTKGNATARDAKFGGAP